MEDSTTSREKILKKVRKALIATVKDETPGNIDFDSPIYEAPNEPLEIMFAQQLTKLNGKFIFCENESDFIENLKALISENKWKDVYAIDPRISSLLDKGSIDFSDKPEDLKTTNVGLTGCEFLVARLGTVLVSSRQSSGRRLVVFPNYHIVVAYTSQLVLNLKDALRGMKDRYGNQPPSMVTAISGPSRTADIEKTLVQGAHGPKEIYVMLIDDHIS
ncbi:MAG TPA: LUD domain-containing protein [Bacteroidia bacterium]|jgi:L-lactate dehydrogenase complex protein LldG|nr:LUD domain-containing protein [Bacteroidia bacterium]